MLSSLTKGIDYSDVLHYNKLAGSFESFSSGQFTKFKPSDAYYLVAIRECSFSIMPGSPTKTSFTYDGDGGRVKKGLSPQGTDPEQWTTYIGSLYEKDSDGKLRKHIFAGANRIATFESTGNKYFYHSDHLGSSNVITNAAGERIGLTEFTPYGSTFKQEGSYNPKHKFTGKELDNTGLYFYGARYYDPELGRFISADTIVQAPYDPQSLNRYSYCRNNPINYIDPTGHKWSWGSFWHSVVSGIAGGVTFVVTGGNLFLAGMVAGAVSGSFNGGLQGALMGAATGGLMGAGVGLGIAAFGAGFGLAALAAGAAYSVATGGWESLGYLAGAIGGGIAGGYAANAAGNALSGAKGSNLASERGPAQVSRQANARAGVKTPVGQQGQGSASSSLNTNKGETASNSQALSSRGKGNVDVIELEPIKVNAKDAALYRQGTFAGESNVKGGQWATENPLTTPDYAQKYGLPLENSGKPDWVVKGHVVGEYGQGSAPASYNNPTNTGGATEIRSNNPNDVQLDWFHMPDD